MVPARILAGAPLVLAILALSGCSSWGCTDTTVERGKAAVKVRIVDLYGQSDGATAEVVDWRLTPDPQARHKGDEINFHYRFDHVHTYSGPAVDACAVDDKRKALGCQTIYAPDGSPPGAPITGDDWLYTKHPEQVTGVLLIPNDQSYDRRTCDQDPKDGGGPHPPKPASIGDQL
ncbi:hypothetical protein [Streptomyces sp. NPDC048242]|uniref:hypothetical protein n=1 Tax=Streptomyces sp. NPDC048242 TaxID=3155026 RepID=UPI00340B2AD5